MPEQTAQVLHGDIKMKVNLLKKAKTELQTQLQELSERIPHMCVKELNEKHSEHTRSFEKLHEQAQMEAKAAAVLHEGLMMKVALIDMANTAHRDGQTRGTDHGDARAEGEL